VRASSPATAPAASQEVIQDAAKADAAAATPARPTEDQSKLNFSLDLSSESSSGNTEEESIRVGLNVDWRTPKTQFDVDVAYYFKSKPEGTTDNKLTVGAQHRWLRPGMPWFWFVAGRFDFDAFQSWRYRANTHAGPGYRLVETEAIRLDVFGGPGMRREWGSDNESLKFEATVGLDFRWQVTRQQQLRFDVGFFQVVDDSTDHRTRSNGSWRYRFGDSQVNLVVGYAFEYQSIADPENTNDDLRIYTGLSIDF